MFIFRLRILIPLVGVFCFTILSLLAYHSSRKLVLNELSEGVLYDMATKLNSVQGIIQRFLLLNHPSGVRDVISSFGSDQDLEIIFVTNSSGIITASTNYQDIGRNWKDNNYQLDPNKVSQATQKQLGDIQISQDQRFVDMYSSICDPRKFDLIRITPCGFIFYRINFQFHRQKSIDALKKYMQQNLIAVVIAGFFFWVVTYYSLSKRVAYIIKILNRFRKGQKDIAVKLKGNDEITQIGNSINHLFQTINIDQEALQNAENYQRVIIDSANYVIISTDKEGIIQTFNKKATELSQFEADDVLLKQNFSSFVNFEERVDSTEQTSPDLETNQEHNFYALVKNADKNQYDEFAATYITNTDINIPVFLSITCLQDRNAKIRGYLFIATDLRETIKKEEQLLLAAKVFDYASEAILITDQSANIIKFNQAYIDTTGFTREEILGQKPSLVQSGKHDHEFYDQIWKSIQTTGSWAGEIWDKKKSGEVFLKHLTITSVKDDKNAITNYIGIFKDITKQKEAEEQLEQIAFYDSLTVLPNRTLFKDRLQHEILQSHRNNKQLALFYIDLDRFKYVNDSMGHAAGDELLIQVSRRLESCLRGSDTVARLGGDEFTVILENIHSSSVVAQVAENILEKLAEPFTVANKLVLIGASIGIGLYPQDGNEFDTLCKAADVAMYKAKEAGRGQYKFHTAEMNQANKDRMEKTIALRQALLNEDLQLVIQPRVDHIKDEIQSYEASLMWKFTKKESLVGEQIYSLAEEAGLMLQLNDFLFLQSCKYIQQQKEQGNQIKLNIQVSAQQLHEVHFLDKIQDMMIQHMIPAQNIAFEFSENLILQNLRVSKKILDQIIFFGFTVVLTHFSANFSTLTQLKKLPFSQLKLDPSLVKATITHEDTKLLVELICTMAQKLQLDLILTGIDNKKAYNHLKTMGHFQMQGEFFGKFTPVKMIKGERGHSPVTD